jgi:predicted ATPase
MKEKIRMGVDMQRFFVITGGPGSGKSALVEALQESGYLTSVEAGRGIIRDQMAIAGNGLPWNDPLLFAEMMLSWEMRSYRLAESESGTVFFDRGVPDVLGFLHVLNLPVPGHMQRAADSFRYNRRAFIAPPWREIFRQDGERKQGFDEAVRTYDAMVATYTALGYELLEIPRSAVEARISFVLDNIGPPSHA